MLRLIIAGVLACLAAECFAGAAVQFWRRWKLRREWDPDALRQFERRLQDGYPTSRMAPWERINLNAPADGRTELAEMQAAFNEIFTRHGMEPR